MTNSKPNSSYKLVIVLACIPTADCILDQLVNGFHLQFGSISPLQIFRATLLLCFAAFVLVKTYKQPETIRRIPLPALTALLILLLLLTKQWLLVGTVKPASYVAYGQMAYWITLWITATLVSVTTAQAMLLLYGLAFGAILTASSVLLGFVFGGFNFYQDDLVSSSAGWFDTAKAITGILVCGGAILLYLGIGRRRPWLFGLLALVCLVATFLTYARAGTVAIIAVTFWLMLWAVHAGGVSRWSALKWFLGLFLLIAVSAPLIVQRQTLFARWSDLTEGEDAGSGRAALWSIAMQGFADAPLSSQLFGSGFDYMSDLLYREYGEDVIHTHNDTFDLLLIAGVAGLAWQFSFIWTWVTRIGQLNPWSIEGAAMVAVFIDYLCHAQLTGQLWGTDVMCYYVLALTALTVIGWSRESSLKVRPTRSPVPSMAALGSTLNGDLNAS